MLKVASANIRFDNPGDSPNDWSGRRELLSRLINDFTPDILGTQEGREPQLKNLESLLPNHKLIDLNRDWIEERMYPCIFVNSEKVDVIDSGDIWLSQTPFEAGSKSFESAFPRLCTWIQARVIETGKDFFYVNTHLDHVLGKTRKEQIQVLITEIKKLNSLSLPIILTGDFNESPKESVREVISKEWSNLFDPWEFLGKAEETSFHKFDGTHDNGCRIDWILADKIFQARSIEIRKDHEGEIYPSDHFPVFAEFNY
ncbi:endonuclease/exonuclease/phosphatase family protein [Halobacteriovorax sp. JY17]|uniref:endonuclease/exonuclease/phosphatase family protein n=1 Tax=Halobacteriovorax sp. JY17 TaxID=2014617 RepID=UPI000C3921F8|nr:endonuclease/exonuclease/phosphatase family protein [Halobacteriovorax sp. JY17]PIK14642.1 MAG: hypothetical protein CES88_09900 [Halobacteriovorax sp. JY17]